MFYLLFIVIFWYRYRCYYSIDKYIRYVEFILYIIFYEGFFNGDVF